ALAHAPERVEARVRDQQAEREQPEEQNPGVRGRSLLEERGRASVHGYHRTGYVPPLPVPCLLFSGCSEGFQGVECHSLAKMVPSLSMRSSARPQPRTTQVSGSSATSTGSPVSSISSRSRSRNKAPPPVSMMPRSVISAPISG